MRTPPLPMAEKAGASMLRDGRGVGRIRTGLATEAPPHQRDLSLQTEAEALLDPLAGQVHEGHDVGGAGAATVDEEGGVGGGDPRGAAGGAARGPPGEKP